MTPVLVVCRGANENQKDRRWLRVLLPKELLEACGFGAEVTVTVQNSTLIVSPGPQQARQGWAEALRAIPPAQLDRDFEELQSFRDAPDEWSATGFTGPGGSADQKI